jgi:hypothetical protein
MDSSEYAFVHGIRSTRATLADWRRRPGSIAGRWLLADSAAAGLLLAAVLAIAFALRAASNGADLTQPPFAPGGGGDRLRCLRHRVA